MTTPLVRRCARPGCQNLQAPVGNLCPAHRLETPPRTYTRWRGGPLRRCPRCGRDKPLAAFPPDPEGRPKSTCRVCRLATTQAWRARHRDELLARRTRRSTR